VHAAEHTITIAGCTVHRKGPARREPGGGH